jgi:hypothetical protein
VYRVPTRARTIKLRTDLTKDVPSKELENPTARRGTCYKIPGAPEMNPHPDPAEVPKSLISIAKKIEAGKSLTDNEKSRWADFITRLR